MDADQIDAKYGERSYDTSQDNGTVYPPMNIPASDRMVSRRDNGGPALNDVVVKPQHYTDFAIEPVTFIMRNGLGFWKGNVVKYVCRAGRKIYDGMDATQSEITDLKKAIRYAEMRINQLNGETEL